MGFISVALDTEDVEFDKTVNEALFNRTDETLTVKEMFQRLRAIERVHNSAPPIFLVANGEANTPKVEKEVEV